MFTAYTKMFGNIICSRETRAECFEYCKRCGMDRSHFVIRKDRADGRRAY